MAAVLLMLSFPLAVWWLIGDLSIAGNPSDLDYVLEAPELNPTIVTWIGAICLAVAIASLLVVVLSVLTRQHDPRWIVVALLGMSTGLIVAGGLRVITAGGYGANIGGGLVMLAGPPMLIGLAMAARRTVVLIRNQPDGRSRSTRHGQEGGQAR